MALVTQLTHQRPRESQTADSPHAEVECTYYVGTDKEGRSYLQLDTYGSRNRDMPGKKSQSLRLGATAIAQLKAILQEEGL